MMMTTTMMMMRGGFCWPQQHGGGDKAHYIRIERERERLFCVQSSFLGVKKEEKKKTLKFKDSNMTFESLN